MKNTRFKINKSKIASAVMAAIVGSSMSSVASAQEGEESILILEELVVTATRVEEAQQDVPVAVTINSGEDLELKQVLDGTTVGTLSPSINYSKVNNSFSGPSLVIRGIGTIGSSRAFEGSVGVFIDGVYRSRPGHILNTFLDVDNLQISRGPQGTLFGKNTTAGALILETNKPTYDDQVSGSYNVAAGNYGYYKAQAVVNMPVGESSAIRLAASTDDRDGHFTELFTGRTENGGGTDAFRLSYSTAPSDDFEVSVSVDYSKREAFCCYAIGNVTTSPVTPLINSLAGASQGASSPNPGGTFGRQVYLNSIAQDNTIDQGVNLNLTWDNVLGGSISAILSSRKWEAENIGFDADFLPLDLLSGDFENFESDTASAELLYTTSLSDSFDLLAGFYYGSEDIQVDRQFSYGSDAQTFFGILVPGGIASAPNGKVVTRELMQGENESLGLFLRGEYQFSESLSGFAGVRWSRDEKLGIYSDAANPQNLADTLAFFGGRAPTVDAFVLFGVLPSVNYEDTFEDDSVSFSVGLQYELSSSTNLYGSFNRGYKSGGVTLDQGAVGGRDAALGAIPGTSPVYAAETVDNFELGAKIDWLGGSARSNIALFHNDIKNLQINQFTGLNFIVANGGTATSSGIEIEHTQQLSDNLTFDVAATLYADNEFGDESALDFLAGRQLTRAPDSAVNLGLNFEFPLSSSMNLSGRLAYEWRDDHFTEAAIVEPTIQEAFGLTNFLAGIDFVESNLRLEAYCRNCADEDYITVHTTQAFSGGAGINGFLGDPRTYGVQMRGSF